MKGPTERIKQKITRLIALLIRSASALMQFAHFDFQLCSLLLRHFVQPRDPACRVPILVSQLIRRHLGVVMRWLWMGTRAQYVLYARARFV